MREKSLNIKVVKNWFTEVGVFPCLKGNPK